MRSSDSGLLVSEPRGLSGTAEGSEPLTQRYSADIYKPQPSFLIEEHMFLLFWGKPLPTHPRHPVLLKALLFTRYTGEEDEKRIPVYSLSLSLSGRATAGDWYHVNPEKLKDWREISTAVQRCSRMKRIVQSARVDMCGSVRRKMETASRKWTCLSVWIQRLFEKETSERAQLLRICCQRL